MHAFFLGVHSPSPERGGLIAGSRQTLGRVRFAQDQILPDLCHADPARARALCLEQICS